MFSVESTQTSISKRCNLCYINNSNIKFSILFIRFSVARSPNYIKSAFENAEGILINTAEIRSASGYEFCVVNVAIYNQTCTSQLKISSLVLALAGTELIFIIAAHMVLRCRFVTRIILVVHQCFSFC